MIIAIDGYEANIAHRVGIGRYAFEILCHMYEILSKRDDARTQIIIFLPSAPLPDMPKATSWWQYRVVKPSRLWTFIGLPLAIRRETARVDVIFSPTHYIPRFLHTKRVMSIMDLSYLKFPELFAAKDLHKLVHWTKYSVKNADRICTISESTKRDIIDIYKVPEHNIAVTYPGFNMQKISDRPSIMEKYSISKNFILAVGTLQPRKNYARLIEAFSLFVNDSQKYTDVELVIIGKKGWLYEEILTSPKRYDIADRVKFLDFVPDADLPAFYESALCYVTTSLYEGFGLPVLEAMAYKCPVVVSDVSSLPEIAGTAGVYIDPSDVKSIEKGLLTAISERDSAKGKKRITVGLSQVAKFTWEKAAAQTLTVLEEVASSK